MSNIRHSTDALWISNIRHSTDALWMSNIRHSIEALRENYGQSATLTVVVQRHHVFLLSSDTKFGLEVCKRIRFSIPYRPPSNFEYSTSKTRFFGCRTFEIWSAIRQIFNIRRSAFRMSNIRNSTEAYIESKIKSFCTPPTQKHVMALHYYS